MADKIKLVVLNENILGYIQPEFPYYVNHLHASVLRGAIGSNPSLVGLSDNVRIASEKDFHEYGVHFGGYGNKEEYEFADSTAPYPTWEEAMAKVVDKRVEANKQYR